MRVWFASNGRGEDRTAALIARHLRIAVPSAEILAAPIVGAGDEYRARDVPVSVAGAEPASGGFSTVTPLAFVRDIPALPSYVSWCRSVRRLARPGDRSVIVGDVFALLLARVAIGRTDAFVSLPKSTVHLPHTRLDRWMMRKVARRVFARDVETARVLDRAGIDARCVGNPLMDDLEPTTGPPAPPSAVLLLPGSRREAAANLGVLLAVVEHLVPPVPCICALVSSLDRDRIDGAAERVGWSLSGDQCRKGLHAVDFWWDRFSDAVHASSLAVGMAGTANEQAAGLGRVVVTCPGAGPQASRARLKAQETLLGGGAIFVDGPPSAVAAEVVRLLEDAAERARRAQAGRDRMGPPGACARIARRLSAEWSPLT